MTKLYPITILRVVCLMQIFLLHFFVRISLRDYIWVFSVAVPVFLLVSAYLYGLKLADETVYGKDFIIKRFKSLSVIYYPFLITVFAIYAIKDFENIQSYLLSLGGSLLYLTRCVKPFPGCGHLWFMQTLMMCYIALVICNHFRWAKYCFQTPFIALILLLLVIACGFVYRGSDLVYLYFYLWTFYNVKKIKKLFHNRIAWLSTICLLIGYFILSLHYEEAFKMGIYLRYIQTCIMAIITIQLFIVVFRKTSDIPLLSWLALITMEFYLVHHLFVFDYPVYISFFVTIGLSVVLHWVAYNSQKLINKTAI